MPPFRRSLSHLYSLRDECPMSDSGLFKNASRGSDARRLDVFEAVELERDVVCARARSPSVSV